MSLATLLRKFGADNGIEVDDDELAALGLSLDEPEQDVAFDASDLSTIVLDGEAAGAVELFLSEPRTWLADKPVETEDGFWEPIIRTGQWAMRPGAGGKKRRSPLKVVAGHSKDQRKEIGLQDIMDAHEARAIEHVTVPTSHLNDVTQNTGFIKRLKIVDGTYTPKGSKESKECKVLMGLYDIRLPDIKKKLQLGAIASRSAGLLYDYVDTEHGKTWPVVLEHVALTNKPWITGMTAFGRKLKKSVKSTVGLSLSDEEPEDADLLAEEDALGDSIELADTTITWDKADDPDWLRSRVNCRLDEARRAKIAAAQVANPAAYPSYGDYPSYRCVKARPGLALVADGWSDDSNYWTAPISVVDGDVQLDEDLSNWKASKRVWIPDDSRQEFEPGEEPLQEPEEQLTPLQMAQRARAARTKTPPTGGDKETTTHPRGGEHMAGENGTATLSEPARDELAKLRAELEAANKRNETLSQQVDGLLGRDRTNRADAFVSKLKGDGFTEERGFAGVLKEVRDLMLADDGGPAVQSDNFSDSGNATGELTLSDAIERIFDAFKRGEDGKVALGEQVVQPSEKVDETKKDETGATFSDGKPSDKETEEEKQLDYSELSEEEQLDVLLADNPILAQAMAATNPKVRERLEAIEAAKKAGSNGNGKGE